MSIKFVVPRLSVTVHLYTAVLVPPKASVAVNVVVAEDDPESVIVSPDTLDQEYVKDPDPPEAIIVIESEVQEPAPVREPTIYSPGLATNVISVFDTVEKAAKIPVIMKHQDQKQPMYL
jgi:hypothetical protein